MQNPPKTYSRVHMASPNREGQQDDPAGSHNCALMMFMMRKNDELHVPDGQVHGDDAIYHYHVIVHDDNIMLTRPV